MYPLLAVVALAFAVESAIGFGATLITVTLGAFFYPIESILPAFVPVNVILSLYLSSRYYKHIAWRFLLFRMAPLMALGLPVGRWLFSNLGSERLRAAFGLFVAVLSLIELRRLFSKQSAEQNTEAKTSKLTLVDSFFLLLGGVVHGAFATGGPMAVYVSGKTISDKSEFRSTLSALWLLLNTVVVASYAFEGRLDRTIASTSAMMLAPLLGGMLVGELAHKYVPTELFKRAVFILLLVAGIVLALRLRNWVHCSLGAALTSRRSCHFALLGVGKPPSIHGAIGKESIVQNNKSGAIRCMLPTQSTTSTRLLWFRRKPLKLRGFRSSTHCSSVL